MRFTGHVHLLFFIAPAVRLYLINIFSSYHTCNTTLHCLETNHVHVDITSTSGHYHVIVYYHTIVHTTKSGHSEIRMNENN